MKMDERTQKNELPLDGEEQLILQTFEQGNLETVANVEEEITMAEKAAKESRQDNKK